MTPSESWSSAQRAEAAPFLECDEPAPLGPAADEIDHDPPRDDARAEAIEATVRRIWKGILPPDLFDETLSWQESGADSLDTLHLLIGLERALGRKLAFDLVDPALTVPELARAIAAAPRRGDTDTATMFFVCGHDGDDPRLAAFRRSCGTALAFDLLELPFDWDPVRMATVLADEVERRQPAGAVMVGGYSFSAIIALEIACQLVRRGREVALVAVLDGFLADARRPASEFVFSPRPPGPIRIALSWILDKPAARAIVIGVLARLPSWRIFRRRTALLVFLRRKASRRWQPSTAPPPMFLVVSDEFAPVTLASWRTYAGGMPITRMGGKHLDMLKPPTLAVLTADFLQAVDDSASRSRPAPAGLDRWRAEHIR